MKLARIATRLLLIGSLGIVASCGDDVDSTKQVVDTEISEASDDVSTTISTTVTTVVPTTTDGIVRISVTVGVDSGVDRIEEVSVGDAIELTIQNPDEDDEFHVHGFDLGGDETPAGQDKTFAFAATETGDFEVESHVTGEVLVVIRVS